MMKKMLRFWIFSLIFLLARGTSFAEVNKEATKASKSSKGTEMSGCDAPSGFQYLQLNNVRTRINTGGDMWWDMERSQYFIPANTTKTSMFSASLWIGGLDINNQLKLAAQTYRQSGNDFFTGPLTMDGTAAVTQEQCGTWDKMFIITKAEVEEFKAWWESDNREEDFPGYSIPSTILNYPAHGDEALGQSKYLAPFFDRDGDGEYDPAGSGDYPYYDFDNSLCPLNYADDPDYVPAETMESAYYDQYYGGILVDQVLKGDETIWWVFNDKGNAHTESHGDPIGLEMHAQAFAFTTNDQINDMTFYTYEIINRSTYVLTNTIFAPWADSDVGNAYDDFVGCDVNRGLGYSYNGDDDDNGGPEAYGTNPPAIGVDFFQGPYLDPDGYDNPGYNTSGILGPTINDCQIVSWDGTVQHLTYGADNTEEGDFLVRAEAINGVNFGNGIKDDERYGMKSFVFFVNGGGNTIGDPSTAPQFYNYLQGLWRDGSSMKYGGDANNTGIVDPPVVCRFMFPDDSDPCNWGTEGIVPGDYNQNGKFWNEKEEGNDPDDRRFLQTAGPFTLKPGAVNYITIGVPWARASSGGPWASVQLLKIADDKCQALFDNCFKLLDGPSAPDMTFTELDRKLIVQLSNSIGSNNYKEGFRDIDPTIPKYVEDPVLDTLVKVDDSLKYYYFEGYQIFQLRNANVTLAQSIYDNKDVRLVAQFDKKNGVGRLINYKYDADLMATVPVLEVDGADKGISHTFTITRDLFSSTADDRLVNFKKYYYAVIAYAYNNYKPYDPEDPNYLDGQRLPYLAGRKNIKVYTAIPHQAGNGTIMNSQYGDGPDVTRIEGQGNGGMILELKEEDVDKLLAKSPLSDPDLDIHTPHMYSDADPVLLHPTYKGGFTPINVKVIDPLKIKPGKYRLRFTPHFDWFTYPDITGNSGVIVEDGDTAGVKTTSWVLEDLINSGTVYKSDTMIHYPYEQTFPDLGISINIANVFKPGYYNVGQQISEIGTNGDTTYSDVFANIAKNNALLESSIEYADSSKRWLGGIPDIDGSGVFDWIKSGTSDGDYLGNNKYYDPNQYYEKLIGGTWAPFSLCGMANPNPSASYSWSYPAPLFTQTNSLDRLPSVDIVLTSDKSKWTRCPVVEEGIESALNENGAEHFMLRNHRSVDKDGNIAAENDTVASNDPNSPNYISAYGYGWFPGYAINLESGERLNMMFGEDSHLINDHGRDMLFNPTSKVMKEAPDFSIVAGGKHYVYVMGTGLVSNLGDTLYWPAYDAGKTLGERINSVNMPLLDLGPLYTSCLYVGMPMAIKDHEDEWLSNDVRIRIRIAKPYDRHIANNHDVLPGNLVSNDEYPMYEFSTDNLIPEINNDDQLTADMEKIRVVPNPYYAYSKYEENALTNLVKITNLPKKCTVSIYNTNGMLIRQFTKDDEVPFIEWDLKNHAGIPIAGGMYIIYIKETETGKEHIVKWFGSLRIEDFNQF